MNENSAITLPPLSDESIARIEDAVFDEIGDEPRRSASAAASAASRRRRGWVTALGVAAAFAVGVMVTPPLISSISGVSSPAADSRAVGDAAVPESAAGGAKAGADGGAAVNSDSTTGSVTLQNSGREIITTARVTMQVADVPKAAETIGSLAAQYDGYVESMDVGGSEREAPESTSTYGQVTIRIPAARVTEAITAIGEDGTVLDSSISREDVTSTAIDLRAHVDATRASVDRLTELMAQSGSVADLLTAESALSERQAQLEGYEQELKSLDEQVAMSTITVRLTERTGTTPADPAGFTDGLLAGWNGLVAALNALVIALGLLLPWLAIAGVVVLVIWLIRRRRRRARLAIDE